MTKKKRLRLERDQKLADIAEHNRHVIENQVGEDLWSKRSDDERKMYPHRRLRKKESIPHKDRKQWLINTPRKSKSKSVSEHIDSLEEAKKEGTLTSTGHKRLKKSKDAEKRSIPLGGKIKKKEPRLLTPAWVKKKYGEWFSDEPEKEKNKKKKLKEATDIRDMIDVEEKNEPRVKTSLDKGKKKKRSRLI